MYRKLRRYSKVLTFWYRRAVPVKLHLMKNLKRIAVFVLVFVCFVKIIYDAEKQVFITDAKVDEELIQKARKRAGCRKPSLANEYIVCNELPYTEIKCGACTKGCQTKDKNGKEYRVPDVIHMIWFGEVFNISHHYQYLAVRSVASIHQPTAIKIHHNAVEVVETDIWRRIQKEIPCIELIKINAPDEIFGAKITKDLFKSDVARLQILKEHGGIYLDFDVLTLKPLDSLRIYPATVGRSKKDKASNGIIFTEPFSEFITTWLEKYRECVLYELRGLAFWGLEVPYKIYLSTRESNIVHMEETSFNRPNPYIEGLDATTSAHFSIEDNYFLHIHPRAFENTVYDINLDAWDDERLRTLDSVYGQAARLALFGSTDLVYKEGEFYREPYPKININPWKVDDPS